MTTSEAPPGARSLPGEGLGAADGIEARWLGRVDYRGALQLQEEARAAVLAGPGPELLLLLEHPATVTLGRRGGAVLDPARLAAAGVPVVPTERGGLATVHAEGQLVAYLIADLGRRRWRVPDVVRALEQGVIDWLAARGVEAGRREGAPGVWARGAKIAAVGLHLRQGVSMHGLAVNLSTDLSWFGLVDPCGLGAPVTSLAELGGGLVAVGSAAPGVAQALFAALMAQSRRAGVGAAGAP